MDNNDANLSSPTPTLSDDQLANLFAPLAEAPLERSIVAQVNSALDKQQQLIDLQTTAMLSLQSENQNMKSDIDAIKMALGLIESKSNESEEE